MATFHMSMKIGYCSATIPHLNYIRREGKYNDREDMFYTETCNLPAWANNTNEFWETVRCYDLRAFRKLVFAIPNEVSREEQIDFTQKYLAEILPNHTYTYAIHETDSAVHGEKNPHVHVMFSERIIDERTQNLSEQEFFKKYGKTMNGRTYGGSKKDRSWAGCGRTGKLYQVREKLEHKINELYAEKNISKAVSSKSLQAQRSRLLQMGAYSESEQFNRLKPLRIGDKKFVANKDIIRTALHDSNALNLVSDPELQYRILQEKYKMIKDAKALAIAEYNAQLEPTETENFDAIEELEELQKTKEFKEDFQALNKTQTVDKTQNSQKSQQQAKDSGKKPFESSYKKDRIDLINTTVDKHSKEYQDLVFQIAKRSQNINYYYNKLLNDKTGGEFKKLTEKIRSKNDLIAYNEKLGKDTSQLKKELTETTIQLERLKLQFGGQKLLNQAKELQRSDLIQLAKLKQQHAQLDKTIQRDTNRRYVSAVTISGINKVKQIAEKLLGKDDPHVGAAHIRTDNRENQIGRGMEL